MVRENFLKRSQYFARDDPRQKKKPSATAMTHGNLLRIKSCTQRPVDPEPYVDRAVDKSNAMKSKGTE
jgi:hypothetical protein